MLPQGFDICVFLMFQEQCLMLLQENEKLYLQLRTQKTKSKANEEAMFNENQRLLSALAFTKWVQ